MARTTILPTDPNKRKAWAAAVAEDAAKTQYFARMQGPEGSRSAIVKKTDLEKGAADEVTTALVAKLRGHGHAKSRLYGATWISGELPVFANAVLLSEFQGTVASYATNPATTWRLWLTWVSVDGVESSTPAGGTNGLAVSTGQDVGLLLEALTGEITQSQLYADLGARINLIDVGPTALTAKVAGLETTYGSTASAAVSAANAATAASTATQAKVDAITAQGGAANSATTASTKATEASTCATNSAGSASSAATSATTASTAATNAGNSSSAAATSATNAATYATNSETSSTASNAAKVAAQSAQSAALGSANAASGSASTATTKATETSTSATSATTSATTASTKAADAAVAWGCGYLDRCGHSRSIKSIPQNWSDFVAIGRCTPISCISLNSFTISKASLTW